MAAVARSQLVFVSSLLSLHFFSFGPLPPRLTDGRHQRIYVDGVLQGGVRTTTNRFIGAPLFVPKGHGLCGTARLTQALASSISFCNTVAALLQAATLVMTAPSSGAAPGTRRPPTPFSATWTRCARVKGVMPALLSGRLSLRRLMWGASLSFPGPAQVAFFDEALSEGEVAALAGSRTVNL